MNFSTTSSSSSSSSSSSGETIMAALINLHPHHFSALTSSLSADLRLQHRRLAFLVLSPLHFSHTLSYLHALSLSQKACLLARLLLRSLSKLLSSPSSTATSYYSNKCFDLRLRDFDAALLLMTMCDVYDRSETACGVAFDWRFRITEHLVARTLSPAELGAQGWGVVARYVDAAAKCRRLLDVVSGSHGSSREEKAGTEVAASVAAVVSLPSVECQREGWECVVCKEEIELGRDVCVLPCDHGFHWGCILPWLRKRNTCPCCRFELPTDDVFCEIERAWRRAVRMGST